jgi:hypothetical protein
LSPLYATGFEENERYRGFKRRKMNEQPDASDVVHNLQVEDETISGTLFVTPGQSPVASVDSALQCLPRKSETREEGSNTFAGDNAPGISASRSSGSELKISLHHQPIDEHRSASLSDRMDSQVPESGILYHGSFELHPASPCETSSSIKSVEQPGSRSNGRADYENTNFDYPSLEHTNFQNESRPDSALMLHQSDKHQTGYSIRPDDGLRRHSYATMAVTYLEIETRRLRLLQRHNALDQKNTAIKARQVALERKQCSVDLERTKLEREEMKLDTTICDLQDAVRRNDS